MQTLLQQLSLGLFQLLSDFLQLSIARSLWPPSVVFFNLHHCCTIIDRHPRCNLGTITHITHRNNINFTISINIHMTTSNSCSGTTADAALVWPMSSTLVNPMLFPGCESSRCTLMSTLDIFHLSKLSQLYVWHLVF